MSTRTLHTAFSLLFSLLLISVSWNASGIMLDLEGGSKDKKSLLETLILANDFASATQVDSLTINNPEQALQAIQALENRLRLTGEIAAIAKLSARIIELVPNDPRIYYLYSLTLAAQGDKTSASKLISNREPDKNTTLYALLAKSAIAKANGNLNEAARNAESAIKFDSSHPYAYNLLGQIRVAQSNTEDAIKNFMTAVEKAPQFVAAHSNLGAIQLIQGETATAWQSFAKALELSAEFCPALIGRATLASQIGDTAKAIHDLETCINGNPNQLQARKRLTALYMQNGQLDKATKLAESSIEIDPDFTHETLAEIDLRKNRPAAARKWLAGINTINAQTKYLLSFCDVLEGKLDDALNSIEQAEQLQPNSTMLKISAQIYTFYAGKPVGMDRLNALLPDPTFGPLAAFLAGNVHASTHNFNAAYEYWSQAHELIPGFIVTGLTPRELQNASSTTEQRHLSMGMLFYLKSYFLAALSEFDKALTINPDSFMANFLYALTLAQTDKANQGTPYLLRSVKQIHGFFPANYMLAEQYLKQGDVENAIKYYQTAAKSEPDQGVLIKLGLLLEGQGKMTEAEKVYQRFIENHSTSFLGYNQLAWLYAKQAIKLHEALELAIKADELRPENASVNDTLGWIYFHKQVYTQAYDYLQKANNISKSNNPDILFHLAAVEFRQGHVKNAKAHLEQAIQLSDSFESINEAKKLLTDIQTAASRTVD